MSLSIIDVLDHYGADLSRLSSSRAGWQPVKCPWHADRVASGSVNITNNGYRCHGCEMKGDPIAIIEKAEGLDFRGAVEYAREVLGASIGNIPRSAPKPKRKRASARQRLFD